MPYDVFISHSTKDKQTADAVVHALEAHKIRCFKRPAIYRRVKAGPPQ